MKHRFKSVVTVGSLVLAAAGTSVAMASSASAASIGTLTLSSPVGSNTQVLSVTSAAGCADPAATKFTVRIFGAGFPAVGQIVNSPTTLGFSSTDPISAPLANTFEVIGNQQSPAVVYNGDYTLTLQCTSGFGATANYGTYDAVVHFDTPTHYSVVSTTVATTTTVAATPASLTSGAAVALSAHVTPASGSAVPTGTVTFTSGSATVGTGTVDASGNATASTTTLPVGTNSITAVYAGDSNFASSASTTAATVTVTATPATSTDTTLSVTPLAGVEGVRTFSATVSPAAAAGSVQFLNGTTVLCTATVASGAASCTSNLSAGDFSITAKFVPANAAAYKSSTSAPVAFSVTADTSGLVDNQTITGVIPAGTIIIQTPYHDANPLDLGTLALDPTATFFKSTAAFNNIVVTDTRAGNLPWTASAQSQDLTNGGTGIIDAENVGLTNLTTVYTPGNALQAGSVVVTDNPASAPAVAPGHAGTQGLGGAAHPFAHANAGAGTVKMNGVLTLVAPSSTQAGTYKGIVSFTVAGS